jgi:serine/threonine protein kinase
MSGTPPTLPEPRDATALAPAPSRALAHDRYELGRLIGEGGMGRVHEGRDRRLGRQVAIKLLREGGSAASARFEREARLAARLQHPGIVTVYDAGFTESGEPFLVMRLVPGRSLARAVAEADTLDDRLALLPHLIGVADALAYAHDLGIVHRDLKPANVLLGVHGETVVVDWGLAKELVGDSITDAALARAVGPGLTREGAICGTPGFMAPEQARGEPVDTRADVYALGAILHHTLSGAEPTGPTSLASLEPELPRDLLAIVGKALAPEADQRYPTAFELAEDLKRFQTGQLVAARRYSIVTRALRSRGARFTVLAAAVAIAALAARGC